MNRRNLMMLLAGAVCAKAEAPRVAVMNFDYATVRNNVLRWLGSEVDLGKGLADMMEARLVATGKFRVYERSRLGAVLDEQDRAVSHRFDVKTTIRIGGLAGTQLVMLGSIRQFGYDGASEGYNVGGFLKRWIPAGDVQVGGREAKALIGLTVKLVDTSTGEIVGQAEAVGQSGRSSSSFATSVRLGGKNVAGSRTVNASNYLETIIGEAASNAIDQVIEQLAESRAAARVAGKTEATVAKVVGGRLYAAIGASSGWREGQKLVVKRVTAIIPDPEDKTKELDRVMEVIGDARVIEVREKTVVLECGATTQAKEGDVVAEK